MAGTAESRSRIAHNQLSWKCRVGVMATRATDFAIFQFYDGIQLRDVLEHSCPLELGHAVIDSNGMIRSDSRRAQTVVTTQTELRILVYVAFEFARRRERMSRDGKRKKQEQNNQLSNSHLLLELRSQLRDPAVIFFPKY